MRLPAPLVPSKGLCRRTVDSEFNALEPYRLSTGWRSQGSFIPEAQLSGFVAGQASHFWSFLFLVPGQMWHFWSLVFFCKTKSAVSHPVARSYSSSKFVLSWLAFCQELPGNSVLSTGCPAVCCKGIVLLVTNMLCCSMFCLQFCLLLWFLFFWLHFVIAFLRCCCFLFPDEQLLE